MSGPYADSTCDTIEASTAAEAEARAIELWRRVDPSASYRPLLTMQTS